MRVLFCLLYMCDNLRELRDNPTETIVPESEKNDLILHCFINMDYLEYENSTLAIEHDSFSDFHSCLH